MCCSVGLKWLGGPKGPTATWTGFVCITTGSPPDFMNGKELVSGSSEENWTDLICLLLMFVVVYGVIVALEVTSLSYG